MAQRRWSDQEILDALRAWADKHGRAPGWSDWQYAAEDRPTSMTVWMRCGSWPDALIMAGLEVPENTSLFVKKKFSRPEARRLRKLGLTDVQIGKKLGVHGTAIGKALGPKNKSPKKPRTAAERREARIEALKKAVRKDALP